jgi:hypothetical protein
MQNQLQGTLQNAMRGQGVLGGFSSDIIPMLSDYAKATNQVGGGAGPGAQFLGQLLYKTPGSALDLASSLLYGGLTQHQQTAMTAPFLNVADIYQRMLEGAYTPDTILDVLMRSGSVPTNWF